MKTATSIDMMTIDSFTSPFKNHSESTGFDIVPSMSFAYSSPSSTSGILKLESNEKLRMSRNLISQIDKQNPEEQRSSNGRQIELQQMIEMQRKVKEAFVNFMENQNVIFRNEDKINELVHKNKLKKNQCLHLKEMTALNLNRFSKLKKKLKSRAKTEEVVVLNKIEQSKERTSALFEQIQQLKYEINEQKKWKKEIQLLMLQKSLQKPMPFFNGQQQYAYGNMYPYFPYQYQNSNSFMTFARSKDSPQTGRSDQRNGNIKGFEYAQTPKFESKRQSSGNNMQQINGQNLMQALKKIVSPIGQTRQNNWESKEVLQVLNHSEKSSTKRVKTLESNQSRSSANKKLKTGESNQNYLQPTPQFFMKQTQSDTFSDLHNRLSIGSAQESLIIRKQPNGLFQNRNQKKSPNSNYDQSKVNIDFDQSITSMSKFSSKRKQKGYPDPSTIKQSTIKVFIDSSRQRSGEASPNDDQAFQMRERSFTADQRKDSNDSSFEKIIVEEAPSSQIFSKPLAPPPKLPNKRLRKVTEQQSDLFESSQNKNSKHSRQKSINYQVQDVVLDEQNLKKSQIIKSSKIMLKNDLKDSTMKSKMLKYSDLGERSKIILQQEQDEDDFMKVNLATVSKISKQKELSQRNWKSIDLDQKQQRFVKKNFSSKPYSLKNSSMPAIVAEEDFENNKKQEEQREFKNKRLRKNSGARFSMIMQPNYEGSKSQQN